MTFPPSESFVLNSKRHTRSTTAAGSTCAEMLVEECRDLSERLLSLGHTIVKLVLGVRLALVNFQLRLDASSPKLTMHPHRVAEQQVARPGGQDRGRETAHISVDRREQRI